MQLQVLFHKTDSSTGLMKRPLSYSISEIAVQLHEFWPSTIPWILVVLQVISGSSSDNFGNDRSQKNNINKRPKKLLLYSIL